jgi:hypothetical protein
MLLFTLSGCGPEENDVQPAGGDFFPLTEGSRWNYQRWVSNALDDDSSIMDTLQLTIGATVTVDEKVYTEIVDGDGITDKLIRVEGSKYYGRDHELYFGYTHEYLFLDTEKSAGESWSYLKDDGNTKTEYIIKSTNATHTIFGKSYQDVIEVQVNYYTRTTENEYEFSFSVMHYYAKGAGEIYSYYPYPSLFFGDVSALLIPME